MDATVAQVILQDRKVAYAITDRHLRVVEVGGATALFRGAPDNWPGRPLSELAPELVGMESVLADILAGELPRSELAWINRETADGDSFYVTIVDWPYRDPVGRITGVLHVEEDITVASQIEQRLAQHRNELRLLRDQLARQNVELVAANTELQRLDELKSTFVSVAAHELRSPLASIQGYLEVLLDEEPGPLTTEQREYLEIVQRGAHRLLRITGSLLDATRIEAGRIELVLQPVNLRVLVETVVAEWQGWLDAKQQQLVVDAAPDLPAALCDETRAAQILNNLVSNASKYTPQGGTIRISLVPAEEDGFLQVSVADNGLGIAASDQAKLFSRFFRTENARLTDATGTGLGLYIARSLVELHGGRIWFESEIDRGSTFHVTLPAAL